MAATTTQAAGEEEEAAVTDLLIGCLFCIGIVASYVPQHVVCWRLQSAQGLSLATILICTVSGCTLTLASLLSDWPSMVDAATAKNNSSSLLFRIVQICNASMTTAQNLLSTITGIPTYVVYYFWFRTRDRDDEEESSDDAFLLMPEETDEEEQPPATVEDASNESTSTSRGSSKRQYRQVLATSCTWIFVSVAVSFSLWTLHYYPSTGSDNSSNNTMIPILTKVWGVTAAVTDMIQWIPQIEITWKNQHEGVLSLTALVIAVVGDAALAVYWIANVQSAFVYATLATDGVMQSILIVMILYFRNQRRRRRRHLDEPNNSSNNRSSLLETPLLSDNHHHDENPATEIGAVLLHQEQNVDDDAVEENGSNNDVDKSISIIIHSLEPIAHQDSHGE